jgi:hypothetical protein
VPRRGHELHRQLFDLANFLDFKIALLPPRLPKRFSVKSHGPGYPDGRMPYRLKVFSPGKVLACAASGVVVLLLISAGTVGSASAYSLLAIGLCNSIMFPTIFSLACEGLGERAAAGSGIIGMAIVGGRSHSAAHWNRR